MPSSNTSTTTTSPPVAGTTTSTVVSAKVGESSNVPTELETSVAEKVVVKKKKEFYDDDLPPEAWMSEKDMRAVRKAVEWYFSDSNLSTDQKLHHKISTKLPEGWLCCSEMLSLEPIKHLGATPDLLIKCLHHSFIETKSSLTADELRKAVGTAGEFGKRGVFLRRRQPLPPLLSRDLLEKNKEGIGDPAKFVLVDRHQTMNRLRDLWTVERQLRLNEIGDDRTIFRELVQPYVSPGCRPYNDVPVVFAVGYERIVYGDHGAYIEFASHHIRWKAWPHYFDKRKFNCYYNEYYTRCSHDLWEQKWRNWDSHATKGLLMLYAQTKTVDDRAWAPGATSGNPHVGRPTGYADYRPGYFYAAADASLIFAQRPEY